MDWNIMCKRILSICRAVSETIMAQDGSNKLRRLCIYRVFLYKNDWSTGLSNLFCASFSPRLNNHEIRVSSRSIR